MNPETPQTPEAAKPQMSKKEASWHETMAGLRAKVAAQAEGAAPSNIQALLDSSTQDEVKIGPVTLKRATKGTGLTLTKMGADINAFFDANNTGDDMRDAIGDGLVAIIFMDSEAAYRRWKEQGIEPFIIEAHDLYFSLDLHAAAAIQRHCMEQMALIAKLSGEAEEVTPGKHQEKTRAGVSTDSQTVPPVMISPSSNGSCQNTDSHSTPPSGSSPSPQPSSSCPPETSATAETPAPPTLHPQASPHGTSAAPTSPPTTL